MPKNQHQHQHQRGLIMRETVYELDVLAGSLILYLQYAFYTKYLHAVDNYELLLFFLHILAPKAKLR